MPRHSKDNATVLTADSSLRNLAYEPSQQGSADEDSRSDSDTGSVLSSVLSSVKRDLRTQRLMGKSSDSTQSLSTRQSAGLFWQDTDTEVELCSSSDDEEQGGDSASKKSVHLKFKKEKESLNRSTFCAPSPPKSVIAPQSTRKKSRGKEKAKKYKGTKNRKMADSMKQLRFSPEAVAEIVQSRSKMRQADQDDSIASPVQQEKRTQKLENVDYVSTLDIASTNNDISTIHQLEKAECREVFQDRVPFEIPMTQQSKDDMSSIHALSVKFQMQKESLEPTSRTIEEAIIEEKSVAIAIEESPARPIVAVTKDESPVNREQALRFFSDPSRGELLLVALVCSSLLALIILLVIIFVF